MPEKTFTLREAKSALRHSMRIDPAAFAAVWTKFEKALVGRYIVKEDRIRPLSDDIQVWTWTVWDSERGQLLCHCLYPAVANAIANALNSQDAIAQWSGELEVPDSDD